MQTSLQPIVDFRALTFKILIFKSSNQDRMESIRVKYSYSKEEVLRAFKPAKFIKRRMHTNFTIILCLAIVSAVLSNERFALSAESARVCSMLAVILFAFASLTFLPLFLMSWLIGKVYQHSNRFKGTFQVMLTDEGVSSTQELENGEITTFSKPWTFYPKWVDSDEFIFLFHAGQRSFIPKRVFETREELQKALDLFEAHPNIKRRQTWTISKLLKVVYLDKY